MGHLREQPVYRTVTSVGPLRCGISNLETGTGRPRASTGSPSLTFRNTFSCNDYWALPANLTLNSGTGTLKFSNSSSWGPDIDYIEVAPVNG